MELMSPIDALFLSAESREHRCMSARCNCSSHPRGRDVGLCGKPIRRCFSAAR